MISPVTDPYQALKINFIDKQALVDVLDETPGTRVFAVGLIPVVNTEKPFDFARGEIGGDQLTSRQGILSDPQYSDLHKLVYFHNRHQSAMAGFMSWWTQRI
jgi:hypothetical protein